MVKISKASLRLSFLYIFYSIFLFAVFWYIPLDSLGSLKTEFQDPSFSDQNFYLDVASKLCVNSAVDSKDFNATWSSFGVLFYLTYGCKLFGTEYFFVFLNPILIIASVSLVVHSARLVGNLPEVKYSYIFLVPYLSLNLSLPGKEIISTVGIAILISGLIIINDKQYWLRAYTSIFLGLLVVSFNRLHEALLLFVFIVLWKIGVFRSAYKFLIFTFSSALSSGWLLSTGFMKSVFFVGDNFLWFGDNANRSYDLSYVYDFLRSDDILIHSLLGIFRVILVSFSSLSFFISDYDYSNQSYYVYRGLTQALRVIDFCFSVYVFSLIWKLFKSSSLCQFGSNILILPALYFFSIYCIVFTGVLEKSRYISQYLPVLWLWTVVYRNSISDPKKTTLQKVYTETRWLN